MEPYHPGELITRAVLLEKLGRNHDAIRLYEDGIGQAPCLEFYVNLAALRISAKQADLSVALLQKAIEIAPDCTTAHLNLGMAFASLGNNASALASFRRALELNPNDPQTLGILGTFLDNLGETHLKNRWTSRVATTGDRSSSNSGRLVYDGMHVAQVGDVVGELEHCPHPNPCPNPSPLPEGEGTEIGDRKSEVGVERETRKVAFVSPRCVLDFASGAATATRDGLKLLATLGFHCEAYCGSKLDAGNKTSVETVLRQHGEPFAARDAQIGPFRGRMIFSGFAAEECRVPVTIVDTTPTHDGWLNREEIAAFLTGWEMFLDATRPDLVWTYGGDPVSLVVQQLAKQRGIPVLFALHNFAYRDCCAFAAVDRIVVPSEFSRRYYRESLGIECEVLPNVVNWEAQVDQGLEAGDWGLGEDGKLEIENCELPSPPAHLPEYRARGDLRYVTFINPNLEKGVFVFARIARELARLRPDIPILVTQGRSPADVLSHPALGLAAHISGQFPIQDGLKSILQDGRNITLMPFTPDPRKFYPAVYSVTKLLLMPSLWNESFGLVAAEAMLNGIPVLASNRGALTETVGGSGNVLGTCRGPDADGTPTSGTRSVPDTVCGPGGFLFDIPDKYTPQTREVPSADEVEPWVKTIIRLWDDAAEYEQRSQAAREHAQQWHPDRLAPIYRAFFEDLLKPRTRDE